MVGPLESVVVRGSYMWALYNIMPYGPRALDVTEVFGGLVVGQVTVVHLYHNSLRYWIPSVVVYLPCWFAVSSLWIHFAFIFSNSHLQRLMSGCFCCDPFVNPLVPRGGSQQLGSPTFPTLEQSASSVCLGDGWIVAAYQRGRPEIGTG